MNGKKARTLRRLFGVKHVHNVPPGDRWMFRHIVRERRDAHGWLAPAALRATSTDTL